MNLLNFQSFQNQIIKTERPEERKLVPTTDKMTSMSPRSRRGSQDSSNHSKKLEKLPKVPETVDTSVQTDPEIPAAPLCSTERVNNSEKFKNSPLRNHGTVESIAGGNLSRNEILKLLDQAQINVPLESHNAAKMRQFEGFSPVHRQRQVVALETLLFGDTGYS